MNIQEQNKFEFLLTLDGNIICQRFFNVRDYNPRARRSMDLHEEVKIICYEISEDLKNQIESNKEIDQELSKKLLNKNRRQS